MMLHVPGVLSRSEVIEFRQQLDGADWVDGRETVGSQGAAFKQNRQVSENAQVTSELGDRILAALGRNALFVSAALPLRISPPLFNRYEAARQEQYGFHIDGAVRSHPSSPGWMRTDLSATLFLSSPEEYDGALTILDSTGAHEIRLPAGDLILYPSTHLHGVPQVGRGNRVCSFFWVQSMVRSDQQRTMLFELDQAIQTLRSQLGETKEMLMLVSHYHNLLREWAET
ncbi:Iron-uptake factor PiuC [Paraburkholderia caribensis MBA4]|uniref:Iron-uptake factor PiuC n=1 Tax=Paraburkholderia caribensis MBA4 TaxID=1323664 RepID=A0A0P0RIP1_9BURK|nr:Fe2+-dependent dioxygenase [Paraburkholderia caribensis]ALL68510.1 Iron-uptake factor PiuC [Paraburkholderia caribensis MBA4]